MEENFTLVYWYWFVFAAILGTIEILAPGIFFLWLALAALLTGFVALLAPQIGMAGQLVSFSALSVILVFVAYKYIKTNPIASDQPMLNNRLAQYVGKTYVLETAIENGVGRVKIGDSSWRVEGPALPAGASVRVVSVDNDALKVEPA